MTMMRTKARITFPLSSPSNTTPTLSAPGSSMCLTTCRTCVESYGSSAAHMGSAAICATLDSASALFRVLIKRHGSQHTLTPATVRVVCRPCRLQLGT